MTFKIKKKEEEENAYFILQEVQSWHRDRLPPQSLLEFLTYPSTPFVPCLPDVGLVGIKQHGPNAADTTAWNQLSQRLQGTGNHRACFHTAGDHCSALTQSRKLLSPPKWASCLHYGHRSTHPTRRGRELTMEELQHALRTREGS